MDRPLRIACYGYVGKNVGSGVGADFMILEELLRRGYEIDFYGWEQANNPKELLSWKNFRLIPLPDKSIVRAFERSLPKRLQKPFSATIHAVLHVLLVAPADNRQLQQEMIAQQTVRDYDILLYLGLHALFRLKDAKTVSWIQGPPQSEWLYIKKLKKTIIALCGPVPYLKAMAYYALEKARMGHKIENSDVLICSSQWSRQSIIDYGIPPEKVKSLPFPIDLDLFNTNQRVYDGATRKKRLLWLGRLDPRKRLDLMIDAYRLLLKERQDVHLKIIGSFRHYTGYKALIDNFEFPEQITYEPVIDRVDVPALLQQSDLLVQASEGENFGFSVAEALSCGLPVVVGPTNGTKDFIGDFSFVFKEYTPESLKDSIVQALAMIDHNSQQLAQDARQAAERNFNIVNVVDEMEVLLRGDQTSERKREEAQV